MTKDYLSVFKKYLPEDYQVFSQTRGDVVLAQLLDQHNKLLSYGWHMDGRLAVLRAAGHFLSQTLPQQLHMTADKSWTYAVQRTDARTQSILKAIERWAWSQWLTQHCSLKEIQLDQVLSKETIALWLPNVQQMVAYKCALSLFEAEVGIMHVHFKVIMAQTTDGQNLLASDLSLDGESAILSGPKGSSESGWTAILSQLWWQQNVLLGRVGTLTPQFSTQVSSWQGRNLFAELAACQQKTPWPALRINALEGVDLSQTPADLPGHLWWASAEGGEVLTPRILAETKWLL